MEPRESVLATDGSPEAVERDPLTRRTARVVAFLAAVRIPLPFSIPVGTAVGVLAAPMWLPSLRRYRGATALAIGVITALLWGIALTEQEAPFNGGTSARTMLSNSLLLVFILTGAGSVLWAREHLDARSVGVAAGLGLLLTNALNGSITASDNPWKFGLAFPLTVLVLAWATRARHWQWSLLALLLLGAANAALDSRSALATCVLAALLFASQRQWATRGGGSLRGRALSLLLAATALAAALYQAMSYLLMAGYLGEESQQRSIAQEQLSGSLIVGGRPEMAATWALMRHRPAGFGSGAIASTEDLMVAKSGMWGIHYQPDNGYVENYMFGDGIKLHSVIGDMWAYFGYAGVALTALIACLLLHALFVCLASGTASALTIFLVCTTLWNIPFGPLWSTTPFLALTIGFSLLERGSSE